MKRAALCQVAAVCYRWRDSRLEFLLVRTDGGKWTFPKGHLEPDLAHCRVAEKEAWEEAGVRGRIHPRHFDSYRQPKRLVSGDAREVRVKAYLLEVYRRSAPREPHRFPTWFTAREAKRALASSRRRKYRSELERVVDRAAARVAGSRRAISARGE